MEQGGDGVYMQTIKDGTKVSVPSPSLLIVIPTHERWLQKIHINALTLIKIATMSNEEQENSKWHATCV